MALFGKDWKLKLRYGKAKTPFHHFTIIAPVVVKEYIDELKASPGKAYAGIKLWALDADEAAKMIMVTGDEYGFVIDGKIEVYNTDPVEPPKEESYIYNINFSYYKD